MGVQLNKALFFLLKAVHCVVFFLFKDTKNIFKMILIPFAFAHDRKILGKNPAD